MSNPEAEKASSEAIHDPQKTSYYLKRIDSNEDFYKNVIRTYKDIIYDLF